MSVIDASFAHVSACWRFFMAYLKIEDFRSGLDARKYKLALPAGTLTGLVNGHITQGGEIEKRKAFIQFLAPH